MGEERGKEAFERGIGFAGGIGIRIEGGFLVMGERGGGWVTGSWLA